MCDITLGNGLCREVLDKIGNIHTERMNQQ